MSAKCGGTVANGHHCNRAPMAGMTVCPSCLAELLHVFGPAPAGAVAGLSPQVSGLTRSGGFDPRRRSTRHDAQAGARAAVAPRPSNGSSPYPVVSAT